MSVNKWIGIGNLTRGPDARFTPSGMAVTTFSIACNERYKDRDGNKQERVEYINIVAWRQLAEICSNFLRKGKQVYIEGRMQTRSYDDRDGNKRYITEIIADQMEMLGGRENNNENTQQQQRPAQQQQERQQPAQGGGGYTQQEPVFDPDEEIPFICKPEFRELK